MPFVKKSHLLAVVVTLFILLSVFYLGWRHQQNSNDRLKLTLATFNQLPGWQSDDQSQALNAFLHSCLAIAKRPEQAFSSDLLLAGDTDNWKEICNAAKKIPLNNTQSARFFFQQWFQPYLVSDNRDKQGLFTGYYLPLLHGSLVKTAHYTVPVYGKPTDLVTVDLGLFHSALRGETLRGQLINGSLYPYPTRAEIDQGAIAKTAPVLLWVDNEIDRFFLGIQGSGLVKLPDGKIVLLGYAASNGRPYTAIGHYFIRHGILSAKTISKNTIVTWLEQHPAEVEGILQLNASYIFFQLLNGDTPMGSEAVPLTAQRSLAIDDRYLPLGAPLWLDCTLPQLDQSPANKIFQHLMIAQDTGGAIKGIIRGDIYWGAGTQAENIASSMKNSGSYWVLLPKAASINAHKH